MQYCEEALTRKQTTPIVLKFLTQLCLTCDPRTINDTEVQATPSSGFVLDFRLAFLTPPSLPPGGSRKLRALSSSSLKSLSDSRLISTLLRCLEQGLGELRGFVTCGEGARERGGPRRAAASLRPGGEEGEGAEDDDEDKEVLKKLWCSLVCLQYIR